MTAIRVLVTGVGGGGHGEQILKALRYAKTQYWIVGTDITPYSKGLMDVDMAHVVPRADDPAYIDALLELTKQYGIQAIFHGSEAELLALSEARERIECEGVFLPLNSRSVISLCSDKIKMSKALYSGGMNTIPFWEVHCIKDLGAIDTFPVVLKPSVGGGGSAATVIAQTREELDAFGGSLLALGRKLMAQEYVGTPDAEFTVGVLHDSDGTWINSIAVKRDILSALSNRIKEPNRTNRADLGPVLAISNGISQGEIGQFPEVTGPCLNIAELVESRGPLNIQCRYVRSEVQVMEINPRFSGTTSLRAMAGMNEPDILIRRNLLGEKSEYGADIRAGYLARGLSEAFVDPAVAS